MCAVAVCLTCFSLLTRGCIRCECDAACDVAAVCCCRPRTDDYVDLANRMTELWRIAAGGAKSID